MQLLLGLCSVELNRWTVQIVFVKVCCFCMWFWTFSVNKWKSITPWCRNASAKFAIDHGDSAFQMMEFPITEHSDLDRQSEFTRFYKFWPIRRYEGGHFTTKSVVVSLLVFTYSTSWNQALRDSNPRIYASGCNVSVFCFYFLASQACHASPMHIPFKTIRWCSLRLAKESLTSDFSSSRTFQHWEALFSHLWLRL